MSDNEQEFLELIHTWVWSGFYGQDMARDMLEEQLAEAWDDIDPDRLRQALAAAFKQKAVAETSWPAETDCDRLDAVFELFNAQGICALQNTGYTQSDGHSDIAQALEDHGRERFHGYCFYHGQDLERAIHGHGLMLAFGDLGDDQEQCQRIGQAIERTLRAAGFKTEWNGEATIRINMDIDWKRRFR